MSREDGAVALGELASALLQRAREGSGHAAQTVAGGHEHTLRQTVLALAAGSEMGEHESPGESTLLVWQGRVRLTFGGDAAELESGQLMILPAQRHAVCANEDSVLLLTVAKELQA